MRANCVLLPRYFLTFLFLQRLKTKLLQRQSLRPAPRAFLRCHSLRILGQSCPNICLLLFLRVMPATFLNFDMNVNFDLLQLAIGRAAQAPAQSARALDNSVDYSTRSNQRGDVSIF